MKQSLGRLFFVLMATPFFLMPLLAFAQQHPAQSGPRFLVQRIVVVGNTLLTPSEIEALISPFEGKKLDLSDLKSIADSITRQYRDRGYLFARAYIPPQKIENGIVRIYVIEGRVEKIVVNGNKVYSTAFIEYYIRPAIQNGMLSYDRLERALFLLNGFHDLHVESFLKPGDKPGTTDIVVNVKDSYPLHGGIDYNNFGNRFTGQNRIGLEAWDGNLSGRGDLLDLRGVFPFPSSESPFLQGTYAVPISPDDTQLSVSYANADIKVGSTLQVLDIRGTAQIYGMSVSQPLDRSSSHDSNVSVGFYFKNVSDFIFGSFLTSKDKLRELSLGYNESWTRNATRDLFDVNVTQGLGTWFGGMPKNDPFASRKGADDTFTKLTADGAHLQKVFSDDYFLFRGSAQWALSPLTITEQYSLGGADSVRGYPQSEFLGDSGWSLSGEFRVPLNPRGSADPVQAAFFLDTGYTSLRFPLPGETAKRHLTGGGFGIRAALGSTATFRVDLGFPIDPLRINGISQGPVLYGQMATQF